ncbi:MAG: branched-chain amino acid aminotransferase [Desulfobulbaceae bacterium]|nr:MAG: branched-chain amino acid aminotransferase [Desulfobulbaceae bacterium]
MKIKMKTLALGQRKARPDENKLGFGRVFTDHMLVMFYDAQRGWHDPEVRPYAPFSFDPAAMALHYGQAIFEGLKVYRGADDGIYLFRPMANLERMNRSAVRMCMPQLPVATVFAGLRALLKTDVEWVPRVKGASLYVRPTMVATEAGLGVRPAKEYVFFIILSPVGAYYPEGFNPISIFVTDTYVRAVAGGVGEAKTAGNYAASIMAAVEAQQQGFTQVLWLDARERRFIEEVGTMNIFFVFKDRIVTPPLSGSILPGITRDSVLRLLEDWGIKVEQRLTTIDEVLAANEHGDLREVFGTGTAAVVSPVGSLHYRGRDCLINQGQTGELAQRLFHELTAIQHGRAADQHGWVFRL